MSEFFSSLGLAGASNILKAIVILLICLIAVKILMRIVTKLLDRSERLDGTLKHFIATALHVALLALTGVIVADSLGIPTASLVAVISIAGLALSLSVQNILANLFSGITLLMTRPFKAGDLVDIGANSGNVKSVGLFYTVINTLDNRVVSIPNGDVTAAAIVNYSHEPRRRVDMTFDAAYESDTESVRAALLEAALADEKVLRDPAPFIVIGQYRDSTVQYIVRLWCKTEDYWDVYFGMNERVRESFAAHGVIMSYPHLNLHVAK